MGDLLGKPGVRLFIILAAIWLIVVIVGETQVQMPWQPVRWHPDISRTILAVLAGWGVAAFIASRR